MSETKLQLLETFFVYLISHLILFIIYACFIFPKEILLSIFVTLPIALFISFLYFLFVNMICSSSDF